MTIGMDRVLIIFGELTEYGAINIMIYGVHVAVTFRKIPLKKSNSVHIKERKKKFQRLENVVILRAFILIS